MHKSYALMFRRERGCPFGEGEVRMDFMKELVVEKNHEEWVKFWQAELGMRNGIKVLKIRQGVNFFLFWHNNITEELLKEQYQSPCDGWGRDDINSSASGGVSPEAEFSIFVGKEMNAHEIYE